MDNFKIRCSAIGKIMSNGKTKGELSQTCKSYLEEWFANDNEPIHSKYINKGNEVEEELIDFMADQLGLGIAEKNKVSASDDFMTGTCDVNTTDLIVDVKASWSKKTLHQQALDGLDGNYEWQLIGYCNLYNKQNAVLFYGLLNTPATDWSDEIVYDDLPANERWVAYTVTPTPEKIQAIKDRVIQCREYLAKYELELKSKLGRVNE